MISQYNSTPETVYKLGNIFQIVTKRIKMQGFICGDDNIGPKYFKERNERLGAWLKDGSIQSKEHIDVGIDQAAEAFVRMLDGKNFGKAILKVADPE